MISCLLNTRWGSDLGPQRRWRQWGRGGHRWGRSRFGGFRCWNHRVKGTNLATSIGFYVFTKTFFHNSPFLLSWSESRVLRSLCDAYYIETSQDEQLYCRFSSSESWVSFICNDMNLEESEIEKPTLVFLPQCFFKSPGLIGGGGRSQFIFTWSWHRSPLFIFSVAYIDI